MLDCSKKSHLSETIIRLEYYKGMRWNRGNLCINKICIKTVWVDGSEIHIGCKVKTSN